MWLSTLAKRSKPRLPPGVRIYAIGDVHGRADLLDEVFWRIDADLASSRAARPLEVLLGDYIDRGPYSREVLDRLIDRQHSHELVCLKGNHEGYVRDFLRRPSTLREWCRLGGLETLMSYGLRPSLSPERDEQLALARAFAARLPGEHRALLATLRSSFSCGDFFFAHAGVKPGIPLAQQREEDLLFIRDDFLRCDDDFGKVVIHGHTPVQEPDIRRNRINIDTGAYATGRLTCLMIEHDAIYTI